MNGRQAVLRTTAAFLSAGLAAGAASASVPAPAKAPDMKVAANDGARLTGREKATQYTVRLLNEVQSEFARFAANENRKRFIAAGKTAIRWNVVHDVTDGSVSIEARFENVRRSDSWNGHSLTVSIRYEDVEGKEKIRKDFPLYVLQADQQGRIDPEAVRQLPGRIREKLHENHPGIIDTAIRGFIKLADPEKALPTAKSASHIIKVMPVAVLRQPEDVERYLLRPAVRSKKSSFDFL